MDKSTQTRINTQNLIMGLWKFTKNISVDELTNIAKEWSQDPKYTQLYIRKASKDQYAIGFTYQLNENQDTESAHKQYFDQTTDVLKRKFGNDFAGWDIASPAWVVK